MAAWSRKSTAKKGSVYDYRGFNGRIGESDIHGSLTYSQRKPRPKLEGDLESRQLRLADLGPLIGVDSGAVLRKVKTPSRKKAKNPRSLATKCCRTTPLKPTNGT